MIPSDPVIAQVTLSLYNDSRWSEFISVNNTEDAVWGLKMVDKTAVVVFRGSTTKLDFVEDFVALPTLILDGVGPVHAGFARGCAAAVLQLERLLSDTASSGLVICGHSLGAARAWIVAGLMIVSSIAPMRIVTFGSPRPGFAKLASLVAEIPQKSYRNRHDPVCEVPFTLSQFPYVQPCAFTVLNEEPPAGDGWGALADHHMELYARGVAKEIQK